MNKFHKFPDGFLWGAATAAHQVEGNNRHNDWWAHELAGDLPYRSGQACNHFESFAEDFELAKSLAHNAHRLSFEWSRIEPREGVWDHHALDHYAEVVASLRENGLEPLVTLNHFTLPVWLADSGGWLRGDSALLFERYVSYVAQHIKGVKYWLTINEPTVLAKNAYVAGVWPPFGDGRLFSAAKLLYRMSHAHVLAYKKLHELQDDASVGFAHSAPYIEACGTGGWLDTLCARIRDVALNDLFFWLTTSIARISGVRRPIEFVGLNYYTRTIVRSAPGFLGRLFGLECFDAHHKDLGPANELGWVIHATGIYETVRRFAAMNVPIIITENGMATRDDSERAEFIRAHVRELAKAVEDGFDVRGYMHWTLMDNFEWAAGPTAHFGLAAVDSESGKRVPRPSSAVFAQICRDNGIYDGVTPNRSTSVSDAGFNDSDVVNQRVTH